MQALRKHVKALVLALLAAAWAGAAPAQPAPQKSCADLRLELAAAAPLTALNRLANASCLGGELDADAALKEQYLSI